MAAPEPSVEDLTARARIRDAALTLFAERGVEGATIRDIARAAGVSGGLVRHHFGSKDGLRAECDAYALHQLLRIKEQVLRDGQVASPDFISAAQPVVLAYLKYFARSLVDGSPAADAMFDQMVELTEQWLAEHHDGELRDPHAHAALLIAMELGALAMRAQLSRALGGDIFEPEGQVRWMQARVDFYSQPLLTQEVAGQAHEALSHLRPAGRSAPPSMPARPARPARRKVAR